MARPRWRPGERLGSSAGGTAALAATILPCPSSARTRCTTATTSMCSATFPRSAWTWCTSTRRSTRTARTTSCSRRREGQRPRRRSRGAPRARRRRCERRGCTSGRCGCGGGCAGCAGAVAAARRGDAQAAGAAAGPRGGGVRVRGGTVCSAPVDHPEGLLAAVEDALAAPTY